MGGGGAGTKAGRPLLRTIAHSSWFRIAEQGMQEYEVLSRGSGFVVRGDVSKSAFLLVSGHVAAPFRFPHYYPQGWLKFVEPKHVAQRFGRRGGGGGGGDVDFEVAGPGVRHHPRLDLAAVPLGWGGYRDRDGAAVEAALEYRFPGSAAEEEEERTGRLVVGGYEVVGEEMVGVERGGWLVSGGVSVRRAMETEGGETVMGMCGGPVVLADKPEVVVGMLEGLVVESKSGGPQKGHSIFLGWRVLREFVNALEAAELAEQAMQRTDA